MDPGVRWDDGESGRLVGTGSAYTQHVANKKPAFRRVSW